MIRPTVGQFVSCFALIGMVASPIQAQWSVYGTGFTSGSTNLNIYAINNPHLAGGTVVSALNVAGFAAGSGIVGAPGGTAITGTSLNSAAWNQATGRFYFRDNQGSGNLYSWTPGATTINYVASASTVVGGATSTLADAATIYNGGYFTLSDGGDNLYRYDLATGTTRTFADISGGLNRQYNLGDIAVSATGMLSINSNVTNSSNQNMLDRIDISAITGATGTVSGFANIINYGANTAGATQQLAFDPTGTQLYAMNSIAYAGALAAGFPVGSWHLTNLTTGVESATIWTSAQNFSDLASGFVTVPEAGSLALAAAALGAFALARRRTPNPTA